MKNYGKTEVLLVKLLVLVLCVPMYPFVIGYIHIEENGKFGGKVKFRKLNKEYWKDVWDTLIYRKTKGE